MIDFLKDANITDDTIIEIMKNNNEASLFNLSCNDEDAIQIINYMRGIGITNIDELLIYRIDTPAFTHTCHIFQSTSIRNQFSFSDSTFSII